MISGPKKRRQNAPISLASLAFIKDVCQQIVKQRLGKRVVKVDIRRPLKLKGYGYLPESYLKRGLDALRSALLAGHTPARISLDDCLKLLSP